MFLKMYSELKQTSSKCCKGERGEAVDRAGGAGRGEVGTPSVQWFSLVTILVKQNQNIFMDLGPRF